MPTIYYAGGHDWLVNPKDLALLVAALPNASLVYTREIPEYAHLDFAWAPDTRSFVYSELIALLRNDTLVEHKVMSSDRARASA